MSQKTQKTLRLGLVLSLCFGFAATEIYAEESRWFVETHIGQATLEGTFGTRAPKFFDSDATSASLAVGYSINPYFSVQAAYHDLGEHSGFGSPCSDDAEICPEILVVASLTADITGLSLAAVPRYPFTDRLAVYGKVGVIEWDSDVSDAFSGLEIDSFSDRDLMTAVGVEYSFPIGFGVLAEYQELDFDVSSASLGASYRF